MRKEDFFEVLGELDDDIVKGAKIPMKKRWNWKVCGTIAACFAIVAVLSIGGLQSKFVTTPNDAEDERTGTMKPVINFEGVVTDVADGQITLEDGKTVLITEDTVFGGDLDTNNTVSEDIRIGNFIQGYTTDDVDAEKITASKIWTNEGRTGEDGKRVINFEGRVIKVEADSVTLDNGTIIQIAENTTVTSPDGSSAKITEGDYIQGYAENIEDREIDAKYILITAL